MSTRQTVQLRLFGAPQIEVAGKRVTFATRKVMALLAHLAVTEQAHRRDALAALLWPEVNQARARGSLRHALADLRKEIGDGWLEIEGETIALSGSVAAGLVAAGSVAAGARLSVDVLHFRHLLRDFQRHGHGKHEVCTRCIEPFTQATALYRGDFLAGFSLGDSPAFDEWQYFQNERLRSDFVGVLERLVDYYAGDGMWEQATEYAQRQVALDPLHEAAQRRLIEIYAQSGQQSAALRQYELCRQLLADELGIRPSAETDALYAEVRARKSLHANVKSLSITTPLTTPLATPGAAPHNLPASTTPFIGRGREVTDLQVLLGKEEIRLITILAPGGMGKTRLALEVAARYSQQSQDRVVFVALASVEVVEDLVTEIARALNYSWKQDGRSEKQQLLDYLWQKNILLLLDNVEHLLEGIELVNTILEAAPGVKILATSRERLRLSSETVFALGGMAFKEWQRLEDALASETAQLFLQGARRSRPDFEVAAEEVAAVANICRCVGGMPLGILLAAAWVDMLKPTEIAQEIDRSLDLLTTTLRDVPERQRSLRAVFDNTWQRLSEAERTILMKLALFRSGFTREAAQSIAGASLRNLSVLVDKSLVQRQPEGRYTVHELLRQYAEAELQRAGQAEVVANVHSAYYADFLAQREGDLKSHRQKAALEEIEAEAGNVRQAWQWASEHVQRRQLAQAMESLGMVYEWHGHLHEGVRTFSFMVELLTERVAERDAEPSAEPGAEPGADRQLLIRGLLWQARFRHALGDNTQTNHLLQKSLTLLEAPELAALDMRREKAAILSELGALAYEASERLQATALFGQSLSLLREVGDRWRQAKVLLALEGVERNFHGYGNAQQHQQQAEKAKELVSESLTIFRELGDDANVAGSLFALGIVLLTLGEPDKAQFMLEDALKLCHEYGSHSKNFAEIVAFLGVAAEFLGHYPQMYARGKHLLTLASETSYWHAWRLGYLLTGSAALAARDFLEADVQMAQAVAVSRKGKRKGNLAFDLTGWALSTYWLGDRNAARQQLAEALLIAVEVRTIRATVHGLLAAALLLADQGEAELAIELYALVMTYPFVANSRWCHDVAGWRLAASAETLPPPVVARARQNGQRREVWATAREILGWLRT